MKPIQLKSGKIDRYPQRVGEISPKSSIPNLNRMERVHVNGKRKKSGQYVRSSFAVGICFVE